MPSCALSRVLSPHTSCRSSPRCGTSSSQAHQSIPSTRSISHRPGMGGRDLHHCHKDTASLLPSMNWEGPRERACVCSNTTIVSLPNQRDCILEHTLHVTHRRYLQLGRSGEGNSPQITTICNSWVISP